MLSRLIGNLHSNTYYVLTPSIHIKLSLERNANSKRGQISQRPHAFMMGLSLEQPIIALATSPRVRDGISRDSDLNRVSCVGNAGGGL